MGNYSVSRVSSPSGPADVLTCATGEPETTTLSSADRPQTKPDLSQACEVLFSTQSFSAVSLIACFILLELSVLVSLFQLEVFPDVGFLFSLIVTYQYQDAKVDISLGMVPLTKPTTSCQ